MNLKLLYDVTRVGGDIEQFTKLIEDISKSRTTAVEVSKSLLKDGERFCLGVDESRFRMLLNASICGSSLGKGALMSGLVYMPEEFARVQFKLWKMEGALDCVQGALLQTILLEALVRKRGRLATDLTAHISAKLGDSVVVDILSNFTPESIRSMGLQTAKWRDGIVKKYCADQRYPSAIEFADSDQELESYVRECIGVHIKAPISRRGSWAQLMGHMAKTLRGIDGSEDLISNYRSAGQVIIEKINALTLEEIDSELTDDDMKMTAFKLGLRKAVKKMGRAGKSRAMGFAMSL
ncbi:hypothetical protein ACYPKM_03330 [Pseudomonas aeruginosa]